MIAICINIISYIIKRKGGEDLRLDQRIQQLFNIMNDLLIKEAYCKKNNIAIKTYKVIPMTGSLGIIEWVVSIIYK